MKRFSSLFLLFLPLILFSQTDTSSKGIKWTTGLSWDQITRKAKSENKFVFVDCFATWCGPCRLMDSLVFNLDEVGEFVNKYFVSIRVQMDSTTNDDEETRKWYKRADDIKNAFRVKAFPTFLFFDPNANIVHRYEGALRDTSFIRIVKNALSPDKQYYTLLKKKDLSCAEIRYLANVGKVNNDKTRSEKFARRYIHSCLSVHTSKKLGEVRNAQFLTDFSHLITSQSQVFKYIHNNINKADSLMKSPGLSKWIVSNVITREEIKPRIASYAAKGLQPDWSKISDQVYKKYEMDIAEPVIIQSQLDWSDLHQDTLQHIRYRIRLIDKYGYDTSSGVAKAGLNNEIWYFFLLASKDPDVLQKGIEWMETFLSVATSEEPDFLDTYANLLYKIGRRADAIKAEERAIMLEDKKAARDNRSVNIVYKETLSKMRMGNAMW